MTFFSPEFALGFLIFFIIYWAFARFVSIQKWLILLASYGFICATNWKFCVILFIFSIFVYFFGKYLQGEWHLQKALDKLEAIENDGKKTTNCELRAQNRSYFALGATISVCLLFLCFFKYYDDIGEFFGTIARALGFEALTSLALPMGISYYTFMSISYLVSMRHGRCEKDDDFLSLACFLAFFPTIVMGPISRASDEKGLKAVLPQFNTQKSFGRGDEIIALILFSCVKLLLISGHLAPIVANTFAGAYDEGVSAGKLVIAVLLYGVVLYSNFSGFIDMSRALALALGFELPQNFAMPYAARNLREFWLRWHITLSSFVQHYIYIPLGGSQKGFVRTQINVMIAFVLSGIWHGVGANFVVWGVLHGLGLIVFNVYKRLGGRELNYYISLFLTYIYVSIAWVFFANSFDDALFVLTRALDFSSLSTNDVLFIAFLGLMLAYYHKCAGLFGLLIRVLEFLPLVPKVLVLGLVFSLIMALMPSGIPSFIYASF